MVPALLAALALLFAYPHLSAAGQAKTLESVPDLVKSMYLNVEGYPCVRLLNLSGEIGCSNPGGVKVIAPILKLESSHDQLTQLSAILISVDEMQDFFLRVSKDLYFAQMIAGVLVASTTYENKSGFSPVEKFPQAEFAPYQNLNFEWNPAGSGIMWNRYNFPVFLLSEEGTSVIEEMARKNAKRNSVYPMNVAEFDLVMQTTRAGTHDSESCLRERSCLPLGGFSVWSSLPPINMSSMEHDKPIVLALATQDSASFFRDRSLGADSPLSGLIALLAAVDALSRADGINELRKQLVFAVFNGEAWGYLGSRRFLAELDIGADAVGGLSSKLIEQVLEIGSVGKGAGQGFTNFFAHAEGGSSSKKEILSALQMASDSLGADNVKIQTADASNPGVPPSSLMTFLRKNSSISGIVLEEFDASFINKFYYSHLDNPLNINSSSIAAASILVARTLYILARGGLKWDAMPLNSIKVNVSLVEELVECLLTCKPGFSCGLVKDFISPSSLCPGHYVGVFVDSPPDTQFPQYADDTSRFVWNFLAEKTSIPSSNSSVCTRECSNKDEVCIGAEIEGRGRCVISTTRYVPAYSTRLKFVDNWWRLLPPNASDPLGLVDPVWTESFWNTIGLQAYTVQSSAYDDYVLLGGVGVTVIAYVVIIVARTCLAKALKRD